MKTNISLSEIISNLASEIKREEDEERIKNIPKDVKEAFLRWKEKLSKLIELNKIQVPKEINIADETKIKLIANEDYEMFYRYKRDRSSIVKCSNDTSFQLDEEWKKLEGIDRRRHPFLYKK